MRIWIGGVLILLFGCGRPVAEEIGAQSEVFIPSIDEPADRQVANPIKLPRNLPKHIQILIEQLQSEKVDYADRSRDVQRLQQYLNSGEFDSAVYKAEAILKIQRNLKSGIPGHLQALLDQVESEKVDYADRSRDVRRMQQYADNGEFDSAAYKAEAILKKQRNLQ